MSDYAQVGDVGRAVIEAIRGLLGSDTTKATELAQAAPGMSLYIALTLAAATIRWASHETGRSETEILDEIAANYPR
jgi:hypothetical protein